MHYTQPAKARSIAACCFERRAPARREWLKFQHVKILTSPNRFQKRSYRLISLALFNGNADIGQAAPYRRSSRNRPARLSFALKPDD